MTQNSILFDTKKDKEHVSSCSSLTMSKVAENNCVLNCAQNYLKLRQKKDDLAIDRKEIQRVSLPSDLMAVEQGVSVLCSVYAIARKEQKENVCTDIDNQLKGLFGFYQEKLANAYFSACNILFDASNVNSDELKQVAQSSTSLKNAYFSWPATDEKSDLTSFFEKVDAYAHQFGVKNTIYPERRSVKSRLAANLGMLRQRDV